MDEIANVKLLYAQASIALDRAARQGTQADFEVTLAYKEAITDRLCVLINIRDSLPGGIP